MTAIFRHLSLVVAALLALAFLPVRAQQYSFQRYDRKSGLESQNINCIQQDHRGFIWACLESGLYRFDGSNFVRMGSAEGFDGRDNVTSMADDVRTGQLWIATQSGLRVGDGLHFQKVEPDGKPLLVDASRPLVALDDGRLLLIQNRQLMVLSQRHPDGQWLLAPMFNATQLTRYPNLRNITMVYAHRDSLWIGCNSSLCEVDAGGQIRMHGVDDGVPADNWSDMLLDRQGTLWLRGMKHIMARAAGSTRFVARDVPNNDMDTVTANGNGVLVEDPDGHIVTPVNDGLARWDGERWNIIGSRNGLPDIGITAVLFDKDGTLWLGTYGRGIYRLSNYGVIDGWGRAQGLDSLPSWSILRDNSGAMWFGNELGGSVLPRGQVHMQPWPIRITPTPRQALAMVKGADDAVWLGLYEHRVLRYDPASGRTTLAAELPGLLRFLYLDHRERLWISTTTGVYHIDHPGAPAQRVPVAQSTAGQCSDTAEDSHGVLWFACNAGLLRYAADRWTMMPAADVNLASGFISVAIGADDSLWLGGNESGLFRGKVVGDRLSVTVVKDALLQQSLAYFVRSDRRGWIWVGGSAGVDVFNGKSWTHLSSDDGLISDEIDQNAFFEDDDGSIWIGTPMGVSHILRPEAMISGGSHTVVITSVVQGNKPIGDGEELSDGGNHAPLTVRYSLLGRVSSGVLHFRYRLRGSEWVETTSQVVNFTGLPSGSYSFEVQSIDVDRRTVSPIATFHFSIPAPWWLAWWTYPLELLLGSVLLVMAWRWRSRLLLRQNRRLETMVAERTVELTAEKQELERARAELYVQATHDGLTGLYNRMAILDVVAKHLESGKRVSSGLAVALIDVDHFKNINDTFGHQAGDATLQVIAEHLQSHVRGSDQLGRYGGEEILMVLPGIGHLDAQSRVQQIQQAVSAIDHHWQGRSFRVTLSVGLVWVPQREAATVEEVVRHADFAMYSAKSAGRNRVVSEALGI